MKTKKKTTVNVIEFLTAVDRQAVVHRRIADLIRKTARASHAKSVAKFDDDASMVKMFNKDLLDCLAVAARVEAGKLGAARTKAQNMDTAARDELPPKFWKLVNPNSQ